MLKFFFWLLLLANAALFAWQQGYLEPLVASGREPARIARQFSADKIRSIPEPKPVSAAAAASTNAVAAAAAPAPTCIELGNFNAEDAKRLSAQLAALSLGERITRRDVPGATTHIVYIPPQGDKDGAEKKAGELRRRGVNDFYIIQDNSSLRWGISLGVFKLEETARAYLASLNQKGVHSARIGQRTASTGLVAFRLRDLDATAKSSVEKIKAGFPKQELRSCDAA